MTDPTSTPSEDIINTLLAPPETYTLQDAINARKDGNFPLAFKVLGALPQNDPAIDYQRALTCHISGEPERSLPFYEKALAADMNNASIAFNYGSALGDLGQLHLAVDKFRLAAANDPTWDAPIAALASVQERVHDLDGALETLKPSMMRGSTEVNTRVTYARVLRRKARFQDALNTLARKSWPHQTALPDRARATIEFERARSLDGLEKFAKAALSLRHANSILPCDYDAEAVRQHADILKNAFSAAEISGRVKPLKTSSHWRPVFIVGMPRSGTSLVHQCLSAHSQLSGIGESPMLDAIFRKALELADNDAAAIHSLPDETLIALREAYETPCKEIAKATNTCATLDKMPGNIWYLGFIALLWPQAAIIYCDRDNRDTALSCYFQDFGPGHSFSQSFEGIANHIAVFSDLNTYWSSILPITTISLQYENLIWDPTAELARLLMQLNLEWDAACTTPHLTPPTSYTASYSDISQPIFNTSVGRWRQYVDHFEELRSL